MGILNSSPCFNQPYDPKVWTSDNGSRCIADANNYLISSNLGYKQAINDVRNKTNNTFNILTDGKIITNNDLGKSILNYCSNVAGGCNTFLSQYCSSITPNLIADRDNINSLLCGCLRPPNYDLGGINVLPPQCLPSCQREGAVPLFSSSNGEIIQCNDNVCILDNVTVDVKGSKVGSVNVQQTCNNCTVGTCRCIISAKGDVTLYDMLRSLDNPQGLNSFCNGKASCYENDKEVDCQSVIDSIPAIPLKNKNFNIYIIILVGVAVIIFLIILYIYILKRKNVITS